jgi:exocyst complex component 4
MFQDMIDGIKSRQEFSFEEYQVMLKLQCGVDQTMGEAGASHASDKGYGMHLIDLQRLEMENMNEDP